MGIVGLPNTVLEGLAAWQGMGYHSSKAEMNQLPRARIEGLSWGLGIRCSKRCHLPNSQVQHIDRDSKH